MDLLGFANNASFWSETVRYGECYKTYLEERHADWNKYCEGQAISELRYSDFKRFFITGERTGYQKYYYWHRGQLATAAVMALIYPEEEKYIDFLNDIIFAICDEYTWCVPAHHPKLEVYDKTFIDLFAAETGFALAEIYTLLGDRLDKLILERIKYEINERIIDSFLSGRSYWWANGCTNNWAAVCGGSVGCTFMLMRPDLFESAKPRLDEIMENFLSGFNDDGYCLEGTGYWHYGFGYFVTYADMLFSYTDGKEDYFSREKIKTISTFIQKMYLSGKSSVSFADSKTSLQYHVGLVHYLKNKYPDVVKVYSPDNGYYRDGCFRFALLIRGAGWLDESIYNDPTAQSENALYYAEESEWYIKRTAEYGFAAKGGHNNEHHNHNDIGSFVFAKDGRHILTDMGGGAYDKAYFRNETRYKVIECSSLGHSVPFFGADGVQKHGKQFCAKNTTASENSFSADISGAYEIEELTSLVRVFSFTENEVTLTDSFEYSGGEAITERFVSFVEPVISEGKVTVDGGEIAFDKTLTPTVTASVSTKKKDIFFIDFTLPCDTKEFKITIK